MSPKTVLLEDSRQVLTSEAKPSPRRLLVILAAMIFGAETIAMIVLYYLDLSYLMEIFLDGCLMLALIMPGLYFLQLKPLITQIEHRDRVERALRGNEELLRKVLEILPVGVIVLDTHGDILQDNSASREIWGDENIVGQVNLDNIKGWWVTTGKPVEPHEWSSTRAIRQGRSILDEEVEIETQNGAHKILLNSAVPLLDEHNTIQGAVVVHVDVTERKLAQEQLARQNEELRELYHSEAEVRKFSETLSAASQALTETLDLEHVMDTLLEYIEKIIPAELAMINLLEDASNLTVRAARNYKDCIFPEEEIFSRPIDAMTNSVLHRLKLSHKSLSIPNTTARTAGKTGTCLDQINSWLVVPIIASHKIIGLVEIGTAKESGFNAEQTSRAEALIAQAAVAIQNAWLFERARASSERLQTLANKLVEVQENEREHIARELHDEAGQALSSIKLSLGRLEQDSDCPDGIKKRLGNLKGVVDGVLEELHRMALDLRPVALDRLGLVAALQQYANQLNQEGLAIQFKALGLDNQRLPRETETSIYRIVQEACTNAIRHAQASYVSILLERDKQLKVLIEDDGIGFDPAKVDLSEHIGLAGMRERAEMLGGRLSIESAPGMGTTIEVEVPDEHSNSYR